MCLKLYIIYGVGCHKYFYKNEQIYIVGVSNIQSRRIRGVVWMLLTLWETNISGEISDPLHVWIYRI